MARNKIAAERVSQMSFVSSLDFARTSHGLNFRNEEEINHQPEGAKKTQSK